MEKIGNIVPFDSLGDEIKELLRKSQEVRLNAYAPFSNFLVGAAIRTSDGSVIGGCNVENSTYGATICAERTAITSAVRDGQRQFTHLTVTAEWVDGEPTTPCGICRQVIFEFAPNIPVYCSDEKLELVLVTTTAELLPYGFRLNPKSFKTK